jgi:hypothetical protein
VPTTHSPTPCSSTSVLRRRRTLRHLLMVPGLLLYLVLALVLLPVMLPVLHLAMLLALVVPLLSPVINTLTHPQMEPRIRIRIRLENPRSALIRPLQMHLWSRYPKRGRFRGHRRAHRPRPPSLWLCLIRPSLSLSTRTHRRHNIHHSRNMRPNEPHPSRYNTNTSPSYPRSPS